MYMTLPAPNKDEQIVDDFKRVVSHNDAMPSSQDVSHSEKKLDNLYEDWRNSTDKFREFYDETRKKQKLHIALRELYYNALVDKKQHEADRDNYFQNEKHVEALKEDLIDESEKMRWSGSRYIEYNQRLSVERAQQIARVVKEINATNQLNTRLKTECNELKQEIATCRLSLRSCQQQIVVLEKEKSSLEKLRDGLQETCAASKVEIEALTRKNAKLHETNVRHEKTTTSLRAHIAKLSEEHRVQVLKQDRTSKENADLTARLSQSLQVSQMLREQIKKQEEELQYNLKQYDAECEKQNQELLETQERLKASQANCCNTILRNQGLRERLKNLVHEAETMKRGMLKTISAQHKTELKNAKLTEKQLSLINEILELKTDFFDDQRRIKLGRKLNSKLQRENKDLKHKVTLLRENPAAAALLEEDAAACRDVTLHKFTRHPKSATLYPFVNEARPPPPM